MSSKSKRQQTMAKRTREQTVRERRVMKQEKKAAAAAARAAGVDGAPLTEADGSEAGADLGLATSEEPAGA